MLVKCLNVNMHKPNPLTIIIGDHHFNVWVTGILISALLCVVRQSMNGQYFDVWMNRGMVKAKLRLYTYICTCCFLASCLEAVASPSPSSISERSSSSSSSGGVTATRVIGDYYHVFCKTIHSKHIPHIVRTPYAFLHSSYNNTLPCSVSPSSFWVVSSPPSFSIVTALSLGEGKQGDIKFIAIKSQNQHHI